VSRLFVLIPNLFNSKKKSHKDIDKLNLRGFFIICGLEQYCNYLAQLLNDLKGFKKSIMPCLYIDKMGFHVDDILNRTVNFFPPKTLVKSKMVSDAFFAE